MGDWANAGYPNNNPWKQAMGYATKIHEGLKVLKANAWVLWEPGFIFDANMFYLTPRKAYWVVAHYSRHIRPGYQQIDSQDSTDKCKTSAWIGPDEKTLVIVTINDSQADLSMDYDFSSFNGLSIQELRLTSKSQSYVKLDSGQKVASHWLTTIPSDSILTMIASIIDRGRY